MPWQRPLYFAAAAFLIAASLRPGETWLSLGLASRNLLRAIWIITLALGLAAVSIVLAHRYGTLHAPLTAADFVRRFWGYALWSFAQQFLLQDFFLLRFRRLLPGRITLAVVASAGIFAAAHLPNPILTAFTLVWGLAACALFLRYRNLYPLAVAHAILGISVAICLPAAATHNMRVGLGYLRFHPHPHRRVSDHTVSTSVWVTADPATRRSRRHARPYATPASIASST